jgi:hypothetical protein
MKVIGFNFTKILAEKTPEFKGPKSIDTNIEFTNFEKDKIDLLSQEGDVGKISFAYTLSYSDSKDKKEKKDTEASIKMDGMIMLSISKEELKDLQKGWKKKQLPKGTQIPLFNLILKKCTPRALQIQDELNIPSHIPIPQLRPKQND